MYCQDTVQLAEADTCIDLQTGRKIKSVIFIYQGLDFAEDMHWARSK